MPYFHYPGSANTIAVWPKLLDYITPDVVHILLDGHIVDSGGPELAKRLEQEGFDQWRATTSAGAHE